MDAPGGLPSPWVTLVVQLNALYAPPGEPGVLVEAAAEAVRGACDALEVAVFWAESGSERSRTRAERLRHAGSARAAHVPADASLQRRLRAAALSALAHRGVRVGRARPRLGAGPEDAAALLAMPFGQPEPYAVLALCAPSDRSQGVAEVLAGAHDALATALRLAHSERELMRSYRQHAQMRAIFSHSSEAIIAVDRRFQIVEANPAFASLLDVAGERAVGKLCSDVLMCQNERGELLCGTPDCPLAQAFENTHSAPYRELLWQ